METYEFLSTYWHPTSEKFDTWISFFFLQSLSLFSWNVKHICSTKVQWIWNIHNLTIFSFFSTSFLHSAANSGMEYSNCFWNNHFFFFQIAHYFLWNAHFFLCVVFHFAFAQELLQTNIFISFPMIHLKHWRWHTLYKHTQGQALYFINDLQNLFLNTLWYFYFSCNG